MPQHLDHIAPVKPTRWQLFYNFAWVGLLGFGGVLPWARQMMVDRRGWVNEKPSMNYWPSGSSSLALMSATWQLSMRESSTGCRGPALLWWGCIASLRSSLFRRAWRMPHGGNIKPSSTCLAPFHPLPQG